MLSAIVDFDLFRTCPSFIFADQKSCIIDELKLLCSSLKSSIFGGSVVESIFVVSQIRVARDQDNFQSLDNSCNFFNLDLSKVFFPFSKSRKLIGC